MPLQKKGRGDLGSLLSSHDMNRGSYTVMNERERKVMRGSYTSYDDINIHHDFTNRMRRILPRVGNISNFVTLYIRK